MKMTLKLAVLLAFVAAFAIPMLGVVADSGPQGTTEAAKVLIAQDDDTTDAGTTSMDSKATRPQEPNESWDEDEDTSGDYEYEEPSQDYDEPEEGVDQPSEEPVESGAPASGRTH